MDINVKIIYRRLLWLSLISLLVIFVPGFIGLDGLDGGYAISFISFVCLLSFGISALVMRRAVGQATDLMTGKDLIVQWTYSKEEWSRYAEAEHAMDKADKKMMFYLIAGLVLVIGLGFFLFDNETGLPVLLIMIGLVVMILLISNWSASKNYQNNLARIGEAYIGVKGVLLNLQYSSWSSFNTRFEAVELLTQSEPRILVLTYSIKMKNGRNQMTVRVPVPAAEKDIDQIITKLHKLIKN